MEVYMISSYCVYMMMKKNTLALMEGSFYSEYPAFEGGDVGAGDTTLICLGITILNLSRKGNLVPGPQICHLLVL